MQDRPILFSGPMLRAILEGRKTMTRRVLKPYNVATTAPKHEIRHKCDDIFGAYIIEEKDGWVKDWCGSEWKCPYGQPGDRLWVRETWTTAVDENGMYFEPPRAWYAADGEDVRRDDGYGGTEYRKDGCTPRSPWRPSIYMPRWASRITLEVTGVKVERLNDISEEDAKREGVDYNLNPSAVALPGGETARKSFQSLWDSINAKRGFGWSQNPWVWAIRFKVWPS